MTELNETVTIPKKQYKKFLEDTAFLEALYTAGVDSWDGYELAIDIVNGDI